MDLHNSTEPPLGSLSNSISPDSILPSCSPPSFSPTYPDPPNCTPLYPSSSLRYHPSLRDRVDYVGGPLDSISMMYRDAFKSPMNSLPSSIFPDIPILPAYTSMYYGALPTPSSSQMEAESSYYPLMDDFSNHNDPSDSPSPPFGAFTPSSQSSCSTLQSSPPLSPVSAQSPEWPLFSSYGNRLPRDHDLDALPLPFSDSEGGNFFQDQLGQTNSKSPKRSSSLLSDQWRYYNNSSYSDDGHPLFCPELVESPRPIFQRLDPIDTDDALPPLPFAFHRPYGKDHEVAGQTNSLETQQQREKECLSSFMPATFSCSFSPWTHSNSPPRLHDDHMDVDLPHVFEDAPPPSPSLRSYAALPDNNDELHDISKLYTPPDEDTNMDLLDSPTLSLLSLPGADTDEDLIFLDQALARPDHQIKSSPYANRLLVLDDDTSSPQDNQRSPSPEPCALLDITHLRPEMQNDEELRKVFGLLKKMKEKERAAKQLETVVEREERVARSISNNASGSGAVKALMDARRRTKKVKDKVREVAILLRLNLAQRGLKVSQDECGKVTLEPTSPSPNSIVDASRDDEDAMEVEKVEERRTLSSSFVPSKKPPIRSPQHLLVKMILDRHEPKYSPNLRAGLSLSKKTVSPLRRSFLATTEIEDAGEMEYDGESCGVNQTSASEYSDSIPLFNSSHGPQSSDLDSDPLPNRQAPQEFIPFLQFFELEDLTT
ncbi:hypothetical protein Agabi119p4_3814 [Agaricus bisporus var. burnettii]|uniref:Uncharacterized protein n=1 Tax=Agaricus bisporus var. burnettii TaxID=192524 RepID=A0A8H7KIG7_AGABI|nr:hypothetical protein Agabi119p4_3814 [Agaricus bisporus var. burnettii]